MLARALTALLKSVERISSNAEHTEASLRVLRVLTPVTDLTLKDGQGRTVFELGYASPAQVVRNHFVELHEARAREERCDLFRQSVLGNSGQQLRQGGEHEVKPWGLSKGDLLAWLRQKAGEKCNKGALKTLLDKMGDIDGLTILSDWVDIGFKGHAKANFGKLAAGRIKEKLGIDIKPAAVHKLANLLGQFELSFYKALLQSCEKRSLLTDYMWIKMVGEGSFGRAHLCRNRHTGDKRVIKLMMPHHDGELSKPFQEAVVETELQQKLDSSEFIAVIFAWGTFDGTRY